MLFANPQLLGSLILPVTHLPLNESEGKAQTVKSARIWSIARLLGLEQVSLSEIICCSLMACWAQVSAQSGCESLSEREHGFLEFCTIALQSTLVVYLA